MFKFIVAILFIGIHALSLYGYGYFIQKLDHPPRAASWSTAIVLGLGCWIFVGGILNLLGLAYPWALNTVVAAGLGLSLLVFLRVPSKDPVVTEELRVRLVRAVPSLLPIITVGVFVVATLIPSAAFNFHDDFHKYMAYPLRMLQTGTLAGSPFSSIDTAALGGQSFLQGFVLSYFPLQYINGFDLLFGLLVCMLLLLDYGLRLSVPSAIIFLALLSVVFINPQYVNVSSLYSGSAFLLALTLFTVTRIQTVSHDRRSDIFTGIVVALFYSSLVALKTTFLFFIALHFVFFITAMGMATRDTRRMMRIASTVVLASALFVSPWLLLYLPQYLTAAQTAFAPHAPLPTLASVLGQPITINSPSQIVNLLSTETKEYGDSFAQYTFAVCLVVYYGVFVLIKARAQNAALKESAAIFAGACAAVFAAYIAFMYVAALQLPGGGPITWLRYFCPILIGTFPAVLLMTGHYQADKNILPGHPRLITGLLVLPALILLWTFSTSLAERARQAYNHGSILAFASTVRSQEYLSYNNLVLNGQGSRYVEDLQNMVPPNEQLVAWISTPLHLNFARNRILDVDAAGLASPWVNLPDTLNYDEIKSYFQSLHVKYILWEYNGYGTQRPEQFIRFAVSPSIYDRRSGINSLRFGKMLAVISKHKNDAGDRFDNVVVNDGRTVLLRLND